ncbi:MSMEG_1061 family FMN-dependent PPOX-type flavoprotein [Actinoalloteichus caeruleus]|uniref:Pyridoxamine 5'-phosphate oxidase N-terminal domain-containing protein n=1 Tax=Actinoalloteichus caeruleus DSM 43889 TaxID=1120930 RepID=A0ABT1JFL8_ACTCY|nr:MSMEG_1061 family FMN-dependent PPOX-type flavoprotein [Actinoalloteichus caeruleus]MCP2331004.1 hypothetical protein [Actinoalloteichus caeruleus DSM 43889]
MSGKDANPTTRRAVTSEAELREIVDDPLPAMANKAIPVIDEQSGRFIQASPFFLLATTGDGGALDVSPRGDPPGSVLVLDGGRSLAFADRPGNRRLDSLRNLLRNPGVGLLFLMPGRLETLRVNGRATVLRSAPYFDRLALEGTRPSLAVEVAVDELFVHCGRSFLRSSLWDPAGWPDPEAAPSTLAILESQRAARSTLTG